MKKLISNLLIILDKLRSNSLSPIEKKFIRHNKQIWKQSKKNGRGEIIVEVNNIASSIISLSYFLNVLAGKVDATITVYFPRYVKSKLDVRKKVKLFRSFNANKVIYNTYVANEGEAERLGKSIIASVKNKRDVENIEIDSIRIGDLVYDTHLAKHRLVTIDLTSPELYEDLLEGIRIYLFWQNYFKTRDVKSVIVSHVSYNGNGILARLAVGCGVDCYLVNATHMYKLNKKKIRAYQDDLEYPKWFNRFSAKEKKEAIEKGKNVLGKRFSGVVDAGMRYAVKSAYQKTGSERILKNSGKLKVLIATHEFYDSPHSREGMLFPDYYEWLVFLSEMSRATPYDWYVKAHPGSNEDNIEKLIRFVDKYSSLTFIPKDVSQKQIIDDGIDVGLTMYGTIGYEYAAFKIPVVFACTNNPCRSYDFCIHPSNLEDYETIIQNLEKLCCNIDVNSVYEYYYMNFIDGDVSWLYIDYDQFLKDIKGYRNQILPVAYDYFLKEFDYDRHDAIIGKASRFIDSRCYSLQEMRYINDQIGR